VVIAIMVVIVVIPVAIAVPAMIILIPPAVVMIPTVGACFLKFVAPVLGLRTLPAVVLDSLMQLVVGFFDALLTIVLRVGNGHVGEKNHSREHHRRQKKTCASHFALSFLRA
jgi:hypothetical protein